MRRHTREDKLQKISQFGPFKVCGVQQDDQQSSSHTKRFRLGELSVTLWLLTALLAVPAAPP